MADALRTTCCIVGGGPAGMMLGFLLARSGIDVTVLEKHKDFFRDFRGDTVHPSTQQKFVALMPQWAFISFLARHAAPYPNSTPLMEHNVTSLIEENGRI